MRTQNKIELRLQELKSERYNLNLQITLLEWILNENLVIKEERELLKKTEMIDDKTIEDKWND